MPHEPSAPRGRMRLARLDGLRGLAAMGVALHHTGYFHQGAALFAALGAGGLAGWISVSGWSLVDLFFVLSGYVFAHVYGAPGQLRAPGAMADFWVARFARLWPLHVVILALVALFAWGGVNTLGRLLLHLTMLQGLAIGQPLSFNLAAWSISVEIMAYGVFAIGAWAGDRALLWISVLAVVGSAWWLAMVGIAGGPWLGEVIPRGLLGFFGGQLLWRGRAWGARCPWPVLIAVLAVALWLQRGDYSPLVPMGLLGWPAAVLLALRVPLLERGPIAWLGERSFGIYMVHLPILLGLISISGGWPAALASGPVQNALFLVSTLIAADLAFRLIEMPARRAIRAAWAGRGGNGQIALA